MTALSRRQVLGAAGAVVLGAAGSGSRRASAALPSAVRVGDVCALRLWGRQARELRRKPVWRPLPVTDASGVITWQLRRTANKGGLMVLPDTAPWSTPGVTVVFGHRTSAGGVMRYAHNLRVGDEFVFTIDGVRTTYAVTTRSIVATGMDEFCRDIAEVTSWDTGGAHGVSIVTGSKPNFLPTSARYRVLITLLPAAG